MAEVGGTRRAGWLVSLVLAALAVPSMGCCGVGFVVAAMGALTGVVSWLRARRAGDWRTASRAIVATGANILVILVAVGFMANWSWQASVAHDKRVEELYARLPVDLVEAERERAELDKLGRLEELSGDELKGARKLCATAEERLSEYTILDPTPAEVVDARGRLRPRCLFLELMRHLEGWRVALEADDLEAIDESVRRGIQITHKLESPGVLKYAEDAEKLTSGLVETRELMIEERRRIAPALASLKAQDEAPVDLGPGVGDTFRLGKYTMSIDRAYRRRTLGGRFISETAPAGSTFVVVDFTMRNEGDSSMTILADRFVLVDALGREYKPDSSVATALVMSGRKDDLVVSELHPGVSHSDTVGFLIPAAAYGPGLTLEVKRPGGFGFEYEVVRLIE